jgi:hypothetical protein
MVDGAVGHDELTRDCLKGFGCVTAVTNTVSRL